MVNSKVCYRQRAMATLLVYDAVCAEEFGEVCAAACDGVLTAETTRKDGPRSASETVPKRLPDVVLPRVGSPILQREQKHARCRSACILRQMHSWVVELPCRSLRHPPEVATIPEAN